MAYALIANDAVAEYPFDPARVRAMFPQVSFPAALGDEALAGVGVLPVQPTAPPTATTEQLAVEGTPVKSGGAWVQAWTLRSRTADELAAAKAGKLAALAARRYASEVAGLSIGGVLIPTDRETCAILTGAYVQAIRNPAFGIKFKSPGGTFTPIDAATIIAVGDAVTAHVQACFAHESDLSTEIKAAADFAALEAIDIEAGWPA